MTSTRIASNPFVTDRRLLIPIVAGVALFAVSFWRLRNNVTQDYSSQVDAAFLMRSVSQFQGEFEGLDSENRLVRLRGLLGRHRIILAFFDGEAGANKDADLKTLSERFNDLKAAGVKVIAVSMALPQQNRVALSGTQGGALPFPLVSDIDPRGFGGVMQIHRKWGRIDAESGKPTTGVFFIDRKGDVQFSQFGPVPVGVEAAIESALQ